MPAKLSLAKFNGAVKKIAQLTTKQVKKECKAKWNWAYVDIRAHACGDGSWIDKLRVELTDGSTLCTLGTTAEVIQLTVKLLAMKDLLFDPKLYGIKITVFPNGRFETEYNHDPNCTKDTAFFDID